MRPPEHARGSAPHVLIAALTLLGAVAVVAAVLLAMRGESEPGIGRALGEPAPRVTPTPVVLSAPESVEIEDTLPRAATPASGGQDDPPRTWSLEPAVSPWVIVNKLRPLDPQDYVPSDLRDVAGTSQQLRAEAADAMEAMMAAASDAGAGFRISTAYRSYGFQESLFAAYQRDWGTARAESFSARAGHSEHQTGWAADVYESNACKVKACFADEAAGRWVAAHAWEYGFILRYPEGKQEITGYRYEPWHVRYVGTELATWMREHDVATLEEAFSLPAAPDYP